MEPRQVPALTSQTNTPHLLLLPDNPRLLRNKRRLLRQMRLQARRARNGPLLRPQMTTTQLLSFPSPPAPPQKRNEREELQGKEREHVKSTV